MILRRNSGHPKVFWIQRVLARNGYSVPLSGHLDAVTEEAVEQFQASHLGANGRPLAVDGEVTVGGRATWWALGHASGVRAQQQPGVPDGKNARVLAILAPGKRGAALLAAVAELGVREQPDGSNGGPHVDVYTGKWRVPWCALFASWAIRHGLDRYHAFPPHRGLASVAKIARWASENGAVIGEPAYRDAVPDVLDVGTLADGSPPLAPQPGDLFLMLRAGGTGVDVGRGHTGFVLAVEQRTILTIAGNEANAVRCRRRARATIAGYVSMDGIVGAS